MYYVIMKEEDDKHFSYAEKIGREINLAVYIKDRQWIKAMLLVRSKKEAEEIAKDWNDTAREDGKFLPF